MAKQSMSEWICGDDVPLVVGFVRFGIAFVIAGTIIMIGAAVVLPLTTWIGNGVAEMLGVGVIGQKCE